MSVSDYGDGFKVTPPDSMHHPQPQRNSRGQSVDYLMPTLEEDPSSGFQGLDYDPRRLSMIVRPLPPDEPNENPEERANRIRSFYKEYFDDSRPDPVGQYPQYGEYVEDYGQEYLAEGTFFDPETGAFVVAQASYAEPVHRRAMTPPPRAPPRFQGSASRGHAQSSSTGTGRWAQPPPRGASSMSGRVAAPKKALPPPSPLTSLPTPSKLKEDSMFFNPIDFAPPASYRDRQIGRRPDSPLGTPRPYSPAVRSHTPLASSFDDLAAMPSPHALRKSGTFTALDFAPPPRFRRDDGGGSDAGSIRSGRSGRSGISQTQHHALRAGAYRVSRIPKEAVGTKSDLMQSLKPTWELRAP